MEYTNIETLWLPKCGYGQPQLACLQLLQNKMPPIFFFAMKQTKGKTKSATQIPAAVTHQTSTNQARQIAKEINAFAQSRSACLQRQQWLREQIAEIDAALESQPTKQVGQRCRKLPYGELTAALKEVLQSGALTKREIVARLQEKSFLLDPNPLKTLDSVLYTAHFKRNGKMFSLAEAQR